MAPDTRLHIPTLTAGDVTLLAPIWHSGDEDAFRRIEDGRPSDEPVAAAILCVFFAALIALLLAGACAA
ncbi:MAG: hypothetical protein ACRYHQ_20150 [Janthinobacterium lividum]